MVTPQLGLGLGWPPGTLQMHLLAVCNGASCLSGLLNAWNVARTSRGEVVFNEEIFEWCFGGLIEVPEAPSLLTEFRAMCCVFLSCIQQEFRT